MRALGRRFSQLEILFNGRPVGNACQSHTSGCMAASQSQAESCIRQHCPDNQLHALRPSFLRETSFSTSALCRDQLETSTSKPASSQNQPSPLPGRIRSYPPSSRPGAGLEPRRAPVKDMGAALLAHRNQTATIYVVSTKNNTICTLVDMVGKVVATSSGGAMGFKNARKSTQYAAQATGEKIAEKAMEKGFSKARIVMKGLGRGKQSTVRALAKSRLTILEIHEHTSLPHNGCRQPRKRRV